MKLVVLCCLVVCCQCYPQYPANEYEYSVKRDWLKDAERKYEGKIGLELENETITDNYLQYLKWEEFQLTADNDFPPARPIEDMMEHIMNSDVYRVLLNFPKGGNMHTHENHQLSKSILLDIVWNSTDFQYLYMLPETHSTDPWMLDFFVTPPVTVPAWIKVQGSGIRKEEILPHQTFLGILSETAKNRPTDSRLRWSEMNVLWGRMSNLIRNIKIKERHIEELIYSSLREGVQYIESRKHLGPDETLYEMDPTYEQDNGKRPLGDAELEVNITVQIVERIKQERPEFIGLRRIMYTSRRNDFETLRADMERAVYLHTKYPEEVVAFDMVGEEDAGNSHLFYLRNFLELYNSETERSRVALKLHTAETNWPDDLITSNNQMDPIGTIQNVYESVLLGVNRIGHGLGFVKHPYLLSILKDRNVAIEICPVSNQILGFMADLRNHPAVTYIRNGLPVILGADDPGTFGYDHFTIDWYDAFLGWGLDLEDLRNLALNSLEYSSLPGDEAAEAIVEKWAPQWSKYTAQVSAEACSQTYSEDPVFGAILPKDGAVTGGTRVHVFGRHFEKGICQNIMCRFGSTTESAIYVNQNHLLCITPDLSDEDGPTVQVDISLDGGQTYQPTGQNFTYMYDPYTSTTTAETPVGGAWRLTAVPFTALLAIAVIILL